MVTSIDMELETRRALRPAGADAQEVEAAFPLEQLQGLRREGVAKELPASLEMIKVQSFLVEAEVRCQRLLQMISSMPLGFDRCILERFDLAS